MFRIGVDTGGTFTDFIIWDGQQIKVFKISSTPDRPAHALLSGLAKIQWVNRPFEVVLGSTVATNALIERKGARTALITTQGFEDVLEIGRQNRPKMYSLIACRPEPLVSSRFRFGVQERTLQTGGILQPIVHAEIKMLLKKLRRLKIESVAVCFLFSFANPRNELDAYKTLTKSNLTVSLSHRILPEFREFERTSTTVVNAYLAPVMSSYLSEIYTEIKKTGSFRVMQSNGGSISSKSAIQEPVRTLLSGPAGGVVGAREIASRAGYENIISFDMGGTSTDVCLCRGDVTTTTESLIANCPIGIPVIDLHTVGAGGGSIATIDVGGALKVGPESAGADPGPICYDRGGQTITVTDAHVFLGKIDREYFLGGQMPIRDNHLKIHFEDLARDLSAASSSRLPTRISALTAAQGVIKVANANMEKAIRAISIERGFDPRDFTLVTFGGAGGLHACELAEMLLIPRILIPKNPGLLSAFGVLISDVVRDYSNTVLGAHRNIRRLLEVFHRLEKKGYEDLKREGFRKGRICSERLIDLRYLGQAYELTIPFSSTYETDFHRAHEKRYGYSDPTRALEIVTLRVRLRGITSKPFFKPKPISRHTDPRGALVKKKTVYFNGRPFLSRLFDREELEPGNVIRGPAIIVEYSSTTAIPPGFMARVDRWENLVITK